jgi:hypothetical protein
MSLYSPHVALEVLLGDAVPRPSVGWRRSQGPSGFGYSRRSDGRAHHGLSELGTGRGHRDESERSARNACSGRPDEFSAPTGSTQQCPLQRSKDDTSTWRIRSGCPRYGGGASSRAGQAHGAVRDRPHSRRATGADDCERCRYGVGHIPLDAAVHPHATTTAYAHWRAG